MDKREAEEYLIEKGVDRWEVRQVLKPGGQGITIQVRNRLDGRWGVFKYPKNLTDGNKQRFVREIQFLSQTGFAHENIVKLLDYSLVPDNLWCISQLGGQFKTYWDKHVDRYREEPDKLLYACLELVKSILSGLAELHTLDFPIVHRDIKPDNIIIIENRAVLIDFGLVFLPEEERLTEEADAVGNRRYSHDTMMFRINDVKPWLDVFQVSQLIMWMLADTPSKNWDRPWHYRFVRYPNFSDRYLLSIHALTGLCSDEIHSPQNARELITLIDRLFSFPQMNEEYKTGIKKALGDASVREAADLAKRFVKSVGRSEAVDGYSAIFIKYFFDLFDVIDQDIYHKFDSDITPRVGSRHDRQIDDFVNKVKLSNTILMREHEVIFEHYLESESGFYSKVEFVCFFDETFLTRLVNPFGFILIINGSRKMELSMNNLGDLYSTSDSSEEHISLDMFSKQMLEFFESSDVWSPRNNG